MSGNKMLKYITAAGLLFAAALSGGCAGNKGAAASENKMDQSTAVATPVFSGDSAYANVARQVSFGPRVPNTEAHRRCRAWLASELERYGAAVKLQDMKLTAFDGTILNATNIFASFNPGAADRTLLLAHWDTRPWADNDPVEANRTKPADGANDGGSGVGVLLEVARILGTEKTDKGIDILFVDAEDWGDHDDDDSWALGADYFVSNPVVEDYAPSEVILLDMVGARGATFSREYFSQLNAPELNDRIWSRAAASGYGDYFPNRLGGGITDDHLKFINAGFKAIDIIEYNPDGDTGFNNNWHTMGDNMEDIDRNTLKAVGQTIVDYLYTK